MYKEEIINDIHEFILNSGVDPDSMLYKKAMLALYAIETDDIIGDENE